MSKFDKYDKVGQMWKCLTNVTECGICDKVWQMLLSEVKCEKDMPNMTQCDKHDTVWQTWPKATNIIKCNKEANMPFSHHLLSLPKSHL